MELRTSKNEQSQIAGENSTQLQAHTQNITIVGIDEKRVREIVDETRREIMQECIEESRLIATTRISKFEEDWLDRTKSEPYLLDSLKSPSCEKLFESAIREAAVTERDSDIGILSELLIRRFKNRNDQNIKFGVTQAVNIVDQITDNALEAATIFFCASRYLPLANTLEDAIRTLADLYSRLTYRPLPATAEWVDCLDVLNACRIQQLSTLKPFTDFYYSRLIAAYPLGIKKDSESHSEAIRLLAESGLSPSLLQPHCLDESYLRLCIPPNTSFNDLTITTVDNGIVTSTSEVSASQADTLREINGLYSEDDEDSSRKSRFEEIFLGYEAIAVVNKWWNTIPHSIELTPVGTAIAYANAKLYVPNLPNLP